MIFLQVSNSNTYYYNEHTRNIGLVHPLLKALYQSNGTNKEKDTKSLIYYSRKAKYWKSNNFILEQKPNIEFVGVSPKDIMQEFINTNQIVLEVTNHCNMNCKYCGYGDLYDNYDERNNCNMSFHIFETLFTYLKQYWNTKHNLYSYQNIFISFYGGEPLVNFKLIKQIVNYLNINTINNKKFIYSMTTNALLLDKYMDFIVENKFRLLISLDGNKYGNSYRVLYNGDSTFDKVTNNIRLLERKYPEYFKKYVDFNSVIHNKNSVLKTASYIQKEFNKLPSISELNTNGIKSKNKRLFNKIFKDISYDFEQNEIPSKVQGIFKQSPYYNNVNDITYYLSSNIYNASFLEILNDSKESQNIKRLPTGTCIPFSRKIFISARGLIYPCERIGNEFYFGEINDSVNINYQSIAKMFNNLLAEYTTKCKYCIENRECSKCIIAENNSQQCPIINNTHITKNISSAISIIESNPKLYSNIILNTIIK